MSSAPMGTPGGAEPDRTPARPRRAARRDRVVSVRVTDTEHRAYLDAVRASTWHELAHWCREVTEHAAEEWPRGARPWSVPTLPEVGDGDAQRLAAACRGLNIATATSHRTGTVSPSAVYSLRDVLAVGRSVVTVLEAAATASGGLAIGNRGRLAWVAGTIDQAQKQRHLINVRLTPGELTRWQAEATADGAPRVSAWVRACVSGQVGYVVPSWTPVRPPNRAECARQIGGAITNAAQLGTLAGPRDEIAAAHRELAVIHAALAAVRAVPAAPS